MIVCRSHTLYRVIIVGVSGTGKSTLYTQKILASKARWKFVYEPDEVGGFAAEAKLPIAHTDKELAAHLKARGIVVFNSDRMFPGDRAAGFEYFCRWVYNVSMALPGLKLFCADEIQDYTPRPKESLSKTITLLMDHSRKFRLDSIYISNGPEEMHPGLRRQFCELIAFPHFEPNCLDWLEKRGISREEIAQLRPRGHFIVRNMFTGEKKFGDTHATGTTPRRRQASSDRPRAGDRVPAAQR